jgi:hypothetical protein
MGLPIRIQRKRTKGWRNPLNTIYVGRPSKWGNPVNWKDHIDGAGGTIQGREIACLWYERMIAEHDLYADIRKELKGKNLSCFCPLSEPCHADILLRIANDKGVKC